MSVSEQAAARPNAASAAAPRTDRHTSFLAYEGYRYLKWALAAVVAAILLYWLVPPYGARYGGGWAGYTLGTVGALLILWLTWFGYRKRTYASSLAGAADVGGNPVEDPSRLARRLSAHVYLGSALLVIATLHTAFNFHWNIHTLAYALMCIVIFSGMFGVVAYARYPRRMTENRENLTLGQMLTRVGSIDGELRRGAMQLDDATVAMIENTVETTAIGGSMWRQLSGRYPRCTTAAAIARMDARAEAVPPELQDAWRQTRLRLEEKAALLTRLRRDIRFKAMMEVWLFLHVPLTFALIAALVAHIVAIFFL
ncbi:MAG TPA: hypothetical protein VET89_07060 [Stellaceae bacterium]|nr:hypothetical protein [Stellaceae bacterium]